jgi:hypothetical protein
MALFQIKHDGTDVTDWVIAYTRENRMCDGIGTMEFEVPETYPYNISVWDSLTLSEGGTQIGIYNVVDYMHSEEDGNKIIKGQDNSKRLQDYLIAEEYTTEEGDYAKQWIEQFATAATVTVIFNTGGEGAELLKGSQLGMQQAYDAIMQLIQKSGWYMYFDGQGRAIIGSLYASASGALRLTSDVVIGVSGNTHDKMLRNRAVVWGAGDPDTGEWIFSDQSVQTPWNYDAGDLRTVTLSSAEIALQEDADKLAKTLLAEFSSITNEVTIDCAGPQSVSIGNMVALRIRDKAAKGLATTIASSGSKSGGLVVSITINERCPRLFGFIGEGILDKVYAGTAGSGVWQKPMGENGWTDFSTGIVPSDKHIIDLYINDDLFACVSNTGKLYYRDINTSWATVTLSGLLDETTGLIVTSGSLASIAVTMNHLDNTIIAAYNHTNTLPDEKRSWIVTFNPQTGVQISGYQVHINDEYYYEALDVDTNDKENVIAVTSLVVEDIVPDGIYQGVGSEPKYSYTKAYHDHEIDTVFVPPSGAFQYAYVEGEGNDYRKGGPNIQQYRGGASPATYDLGNTVYIQDDTNNISKSIVLRGNNVAFPASYNTQIVVTEYEFTSDSGGDYVDYTNSTYDLDSSNWLAPWRAFIGESIHTSTYPPIHVSLISSSYVHTYYSIDTETSSVDSQTVVDYGAAGDEDIFGTAMSNYIVYTLIRKRKDVGGGNFEDWFYMDKWDWINTIYTRTLLYKYENDNATYARDKIFNVTPNMNALVIPKSTGGVYYQIPQYIVADTTIWVIHGTASTATRTQIFSKHAYETGFVAGDFADDTIFINPGGADREHAGTLIRHTFKTQGPGGSQVNAIMTAYGDAGFEQSGTYDDGTLSGSDTLTGADIPRYAYSQTPLCGQSGDSEVLKFVEFDTTSDVFVIRDYIGETLNNFGLPGTYTKTECVSPYVDEHRNMVMAVCYDGITEYELIGISLEDGGLLAYPGDSNFKWSSTPYPKNIMTIMRFVSYYEDDTGPPQTRDKFISYLHPYNDYESQRQTRQYSVMRHDYVETGGTDTFTTVLNPSYRPKLEISKPAPTVVFNAFSGIRDPLLEVGNYPTIYTTYDLITFSGITMTYDTYDLRVFDSDGEYEAASGVVDGFRYAAVSSSGFINAIPVDSYTTTSSPARIETNNGTITHLETTNIINPYMFYCLLGSPDARFFEKSGIMVEGLYVAGLSAINKATTFTEYSSGLPGGTNITVIRVDDKI